MEQSLNYAVAIDEPLDLNDPHVFVDIELEYPQGSATEIIVKVEAVSINPADSRARLRKTKDGQHTVLGWDVAGEIVELGSDVPQDFQIGDAVYYAGDIRRSGGNCSYHAIDYRLVGHRPKSIPATEAAALPLVSLTAWEVLFERFNLPLCSSAACELFNHHSHDKCALLVIGGAGGVGSMAIQLAKLVPHLVVIATASRPETTEWCLKLGADHVINHRQDIPAQLAALGYPEVDYVLICNSPDQYFTLLPKIVRPFGKICNIVPFHEKQDFNLIMHKSLSFYWEFMFTYSSYDPEHMSAQSQTLNQIAKLIDEGQIISPMSTTLAPLNAAQVRQAHQLIESNASMGKIVIQR